MLSKIKDPFVAFFLSLFGAASLVIPDPLKLASFWVVTVVLLKLVPWSSLPDSTPVDVRKLSKQAEYTTVAVLLVIWAFGIIGSTALLEYFPSMLEKASIKSYSALAKLDESMRPSAYPNAPGAPAEKPYLHMTVKPQGEERHFPTVQVIKGAIDELVGSVPVYSVWFFLAVTAVYLLLTFLMSVMSRIAAASTPAKEE